ncbi:hypothetical protein [Rheinheimera sp. KL1]|uniref:hypothetical protein n=1 Tax=Rheinheimera sp. KL1 TaxID=1635005 RepID=UPI000AD2CF2F|nr:hypothetical protein [Rheinheimera sp. KL1]
MILSIKNKTLAALALLSVLSQPAFATDNQLTAEEQADGWQLLFNGKDMSQWRSFKQQLSTRNGKLKMALSP